MTRPNGISMRNDKVIYNDRGSPVCVCTEMTSQHCLEGVKSVCLCRLVCKLDYEKKTSCVLRLACLKGTEACSEQKPPRATGAYGRFASTRRMLKLSLVHCPTRTQCRGTRCNLLWVVAALTARDK